MDKIIVNDLLIRGIIGINPDERVKKQDILVNLVLYADIRPAATASWKTPEERIASATRSGVTLPSPRRKASSVVIAAFSASSSTVAAAA